MKKASKKLIIISGVLGTLGRAYFEHYITEPGVVLYGLSRKGLSLEELDFKIPTTHSFILKVDLTNKNDCNKFIDAIDAHEFKEIVYIHGVDEFKTEINPSLFCQKSRTTKTETVLTTRYTV